MSIFITGTGTDVGKTLVAAVIMAKYARRSNLRYWKPVQTGVDQDVNKIQLLTGLSNDYFHENLYWFSKPASPHYSAFLENQEIQLDKIINYYLQNHSSLSIIEGAGGCLVPLNSKHLTIDLIEALKIPVLLVASSQLGTINHTLLSIEVLSKKNIPIIGFIVQGPENDLLLNNIETIQYFSGQKCIGHIHIPEFICTEVEFLDYVHSRFDFLERFFLFNSI